MQLARFNAMASPSGSQGTIRKKLTSLKVEFDPKVMVASPMKAPFLSGGGRAAIL